MHFQCNKHDLLKGITLVERALSTQGTLQILSGIHLKTEQNKLVLTSTNLEINIQTTVQCTTMTAGSIILEGRLLSSISKKLPDDNIIFEQKENRMVITAGTIEFTLNVLTTENFPEFPQHQESLMSISSYLLEKAIRSTIFATANDETRPVLSGVLFEVEEDFLNLVATDSNRLVFFQTKPAFENKGKLRVVLPHRTLSELGKCFPAEDTTVLVSSAHNQLIFKFDDTVFASRIIEGQFPNYRVVFPAEQPINIVVKKQSIHAAIERAALFDRKGNQPVIFQVSDGVLEIKTAPSDLGQLSEQINVEHTGENGKAAYSTKYLSDMLKATDAEQIQFEFNTEHRQALMRPADNGNHKYIIMPVRID